MCHPYHWIHEIIDWEVSCRLWLGFLKNFFKNPIERNVWITGFNMLLRGSASTTNQEYFIGFGFSIQRGTRAMMLNISQVLKDPQKDKANFSFIKFVFCVPVRWMCREDFLTYCNIEMYNPSMSEIKPKSKNKNTLKAAVAISECEGNGRHSEFLMTLWSRLIHANDNTLGIIQHKPNITHKCFFDCDLFFNPLHITKYWFNDNKNTLKSDTWNEVIPVMPKTLHSSLVIHVS